MNAEVFARRLGAYYHVGNSSGSHAAAGKFPMKANMRFLKKFPVADFTGDPQTLGNARIEDRVKASLMLRATLGIKILSVTNDEGQLDLRSKIVRGKWTPISEVLNRARLYQVKKPAEYEGKSFEQIRDIEHRLNIKTTAIGIAAATSTIVFGLLGGLPNDVLHEVGINIADHSMAKLWCQSLALVSLGTWIPTWWRAAQMKNSQNLYNYFRIKSGQLPLHTIF